MAHARTRRSRGHDDHVEHENEERWLVSYADMVTLLMCLFLVLFSISSVNTSKFEALQRALQDAFSGRVLPGGKAVMEAGSGEQTKKEAPQPPVPAITPVEAAMELDTPATQAAAAAAAAQEQEDFRRLKERIDRAAAELGIARNIKTSIRARGLVVRLLTDGVFFDSGSAVLKPQSRPILDRLARLIAAERRHPIVVEGYTDSQPIATPSYPSNWELSGARASSVVRRFIHGGVLTQRLSLSGYAHQHPIESNATAAGRSQNRRVEVVMTRLYPSPGQGGTR